MSELYNGKTLPQGWCVYFTADDRPYFYDRIRGKTQWEEPVGPAGGGEGSPGRLTGDPSSLMLGASASTMDLHSSDSRKMIGLHTAENSDEEQDTSSIIDGEITRGGGARQVQGLGMKRKGDYASIPLHERTGRIGEPGGALLMGEMDPAAGGRPGSRTTQKDGILYRHEQGLTFVRLPFSLDPIKKFFDVDTLTVRNRILASVLPWRVLQQLKEEVVSAAGGGEAATGGSTGSPTMVTVVTSAAAAESNLAALSFVGGDDEVLGSIRDRPDFYGPFWIATTLILLLFVTSQSAALLTGHAASTDYVTLVSAASLCYGYEFVVPALLYGVVLLLGDDNLKQSLTFSQLFSVYGYSFSVAYPTALLCLIPFTAAHWSVAALAATTTIVYLYFSFKRELFDASGRSKMMLIGLICVAQLSLYASLPLCFFRFRNK